MLSNYYQRIIMINENEKLGLRYIDVAYDWTKHDDKIICNKMEIETLLKTYKTLKNNDNINNFNNDDIILSNHQRRYLKLVRIINQ